MKLHLQGIALPKLGSIQDRIYRQYLVRESQLEAKRSEMAMLTLLTNPTVTDANGGRQWADTVKKVWTEYVGLLMNVEIPEHDDEERRMLEYYEGTVKHSKVSMYKDGKTGGLHVLGTDSL